MRVVYFSGSTCDHKFGISSFFHFTRQQAGGQRCPGAARKVSFRMQKSWYGWRWDTYPSVSTAATKIVDYRKPNLFKTGSWLRGDRRYTTGFNRIATPATAMSDEHAAWPLFAGNDPEDDSEWHANGGIGILPARSSGQSNISSPRENAIPG